MHTPTVTEISRQAYVNAQKARHQTQVRLVRQSLFLRPDADVKRT